MEVVAVFSRPWVVWWKTEGGRRWWWRAATRESAQGLLNRHNEDCTRRGEFMQRALIGWDPDGKEFPNRGNRIMDGDIRSYQP